MSGSLWPRLAAIIFGLSIASGGAAKAADIGQQRVDAPIQLGAAEMDKISAGGYAVGSGTGKAAGTLSQTTASVSGITILGGKYANFAVGRVTASGMSSSGADATATSTLSLTVICQ